MKMKTEKVQLTRYIDSLQSQGRYYFDRQQAIEATGSSYSAFRQAAYRLDKKNRIKKVLADFFIIIPAEYVYAATLPASWFIDPLMKHLGLEYYVGLLSAAAIYGAAHQQPMLFQVVTNQVLRPISIGKMAIMFHYRKKVEPSYYAKIKTETGQMNVAIPEVVVCDCLRYPQAAGYIQNIATVLLELQDQLKMESLLAYIKAGNLELVNAQRLGYLIEQLKLSIDTTPLLQWIQEQASQYCLLVPGLSKTERYNEKWKVVVNDDVEPDEL